MLTLKKTRFHLCTEGFGLHEKHSAIIANNKITYNVQKLFIGSGTEIKLGRNKTFAIVRAIVFAICVIKKNERILPVIYAAAN